MSKEEKRLSRNEAIQGIYRFTDQQQTLILTTATLQKQAVYIPLHPAKRQEAYTGLLFKLNICNNCFEWQQKNALSNNVTTCCQSFEAK